MTTVLEYWRRHWAGLVLTLIVIVGLMVRLGRVGTVPYGLNRDEAALAYNAFLLAQTGRDEWGRVWPMFLESFGDQKLPGYPYLLVGLFKCGLLETIPGDFLVRLPSVLAGTVLIVLSYFLAQLFGNARRREVGLLAAALVALNPIFVWYSRGAWEANVALCLWAGAAYLVVRQWRTGQSWTLIRLTAILVLLLASVFTYNSPLIITSVLIFFLPWWGRRHGWRWWAPLTVVVLVAVVASYALLLPVTRQKNGITIFADPTVYHHFIEYRESLPVWSRRLAGNCYVYYAGILLRHTLASISVSFWRGGGTHPWHQLAGWGHVTVVALGLSYLALVWLLGTWIRSAYCAIRQKRLSRWWDHGAVMTSIVLLACLAPSVITTDSPHATRSLEFFWVLMIATSVVWGQLFGKWQTRTKLDTVHLFLVLVMIGMAGEMSWYLRDYFRDVPAKNIYNQGFETLLDSLDTSQLTLVQSVERQYEYIKFAWALRLPPEEFWRTLIREEPDVAGIKAGSDLLNFHFSDNDYTDDQYPQGLWYNSEQGVWERWP